MINSSDKLEWLFPDTTLNFDKLTLAFKGFCCHSLANDNFLLLPSNLNIGVLQYKTNFYSFSTSKAAELFIQDIQEFAYLFISFLFIYIEEFTLF
jgi:hypothetical protein